jgi:adenosylhomocysteine nucleosidase
MSLPALLAPTLVCFAVSQEAKPFQRMIRGRSDVHVLLTGMGAHNATQALRDALETIQPGRVFTCGFAGALNPSLQIGDVVFGAKVLPNIAQRLQAAGTKQVVSACAERVAITAVEKCALRVQTNADVVEMESAIIERVCREAGVECITLRAISDTAHEDLPLDFNALMTTEQKLNPAKLALAILRRPQRIPALLRLGKNSSIAAEKLGKVLVAVI